MKQAIKTLGVVIVALALVLLTACSAASTATWQQQFDLGMKYLSEGNYQEAILAFTAAIEIDPKQVDPYLQLIDAYIANGEYEKAEEIRQKGYEATGDPRLEEPQPEEPLSPDSAQETADASGGFWAAYFKSYDQMTENERELVQALSGAMQAEDMDALISIEENGERDILLYTAWDDKSIMIAAGSGAEILQQINAELVAELTEQNSVEEEMEQQSILFSVYFQENGVYRRFGTMQDNGSTGALIHVINTADYQDGKLNGNYVQQTRIISPWGEDYSVERGVVVENAYQLPDTMHIERRDGNYTTIGDLYYEGGKQVTKMTIYDENGNVVDTYYEP